MASREFRLRRAQKLALKPLPVVISGLLTLALVGACSSKANNAGSTSPSGASSSGSGPGSTLNIGVLASVSGVAPGVSETAWKAVRAYAAMVNSQGGINGRKLNVITADDGLDPVKGKAACAAVIPRVFAMVGNVGFGDAGCFPEVQSSGIPWIGFSYDSAQFYSLHNVLYPGQTPSGAIVTSTYLQYQKMFPEVKKVALLYTNVAGNIPYANGQASVLSSLGIQSIKIPIPGDAVNLTNYVLQMKKEGVQGILADALPEAQLAKLAQTMVQQDYDPPLKENTQVYDSSWAKLAGTAGKGWFANLSYIPYLSTEEMNATAGGKDFLKWYTETNPGAKVDQWAIDAWAYADFFAQGVKSAGANLTTSSFLEAAYAIKDFSAGGLIGPVTPSKKLPSTCFIIMKANGDGSYTRVHPSDQFDCSQGTVALPK